MSKFVNVLRAVSAGATMVLALAAAPANALPITYNFSGVFDDGQTAMGQLSLDSYGYNSDPTTITTTDGSITGYIYVLGTDPINISPDKTTVDFSRSVPNYYQGFLHLVFDHPLTDGTLDDLVAAQSFECDGYDDGFGNCTGDIRYFTSGSAAPAPEPATLAILGAGLAGIATRRRKRA